MSKSLGAGVQCNRQSPCTRCTKSGTECIPGQAMTKIVFKGKDPALAPKPLMQNPAIILDTKFAEYVLQNSDGSWSSIPQTHGTVQLKSSPGCLRQEIEVVSSEQVLKIDPSLGQTRRGRKRKSDEVLLTEPAVADDQTSGRPLPDRKRKLDGVSLEDPNSPKVKKARHSVVKTKFAAPFNAILSIHVQQEANGCWRSDPQTPPRFKKQRVAKKEAKYGVPHEEESLPSSQGSFTKSLFASPKEKSALPKRKFNTFKPGPYVKYHKSAQENKPLPIGSPPVWAEKRQALCESLPYYRAYMSGAYAQNGLARCFMVDKEVGPRDKFTEEIMIARVWVVSLYFSTTITLTES